MITWRRGAAPALALGLFVACAQDAQAHLVETGLGPVYDGIAHFAASADDLLPAFAIAVFAGLRGKDQVRGVIFVLPVAWLLAGVAGLWSGGPAIAVPLWCVLMTLGVLVASDLALPNAATCIVAALLGAILGISNGAALERSGSGVRELVGIVGAAFVLTTLISAAVLALGAGWARIAWRVAGSWIAASGLLLLGWSLRR